MSTGMPKRRAVSMRLILLAVGVLLILLAALSIASADTTYTRTVLHTFQSTLSISVAALDNGDVVAGEIVS